MIRVLAVIPARGGSKAIPRKNLVPIAGRPLLAYTCAAVKNSRLIDRAILSTDDEEIASVARGLGLETPFMRPAALAGDTTPMIDVLRHALEEMAAQHYVPDAVVVLQPTSPLRQAHHVNGAIQLLNDSGADTVVSVVPVPHQFTPGSLLCVADGRAVPYDDGSAVLRRQDKPALFARNGPAVLVIRRATLESGNLYGADVRVLEMTAADSVDIDTLDDLSLAEYYLDRRKVDVR